MTGMCLDVYFQVQGGDYRRFTQNVISQVLAEQQRTFICDSMLVIHEFVTVDELVIRGKDDSKGSFANFLKDAPAIDLFSMLRRLLVQRMVVGRQL